MNEDSYGLREEDMTLLGGWHCSGVRPVFCETATGCQVTAGPVPYLSFAIMTLVILSFFIGIWVLLATQKPASLTLFVRTLIILIGIVAVAVPLIGHSSQIRHLRLTSPVLDFDAGKQTVSILNGQAEFPVENIFCIMLLARPWDLRAWSSSGDYVVSEAQLVVDSPEGRSRHLLDSSISSYTFVFRKSFVPFAEHSGIRLLKVESRRKFCGLGTTHLVVSELHSPSRVHRIDFH